MNTLEKFFYEPIRFRGLFVMRAAFGLIAIFYYLRLMPYLQVFFGPSGVGGHDTAARWPSFPIAVTEGFEHYEALRHVAQPGVVWGLWLGLLVSATCFAVGLLTRPAGLALAALHVVFAAHQPHLTMGWAQLYPAFVVYLALAPSGQAWSVDVWRHQRKDPSYLGSASVTPWALRVLQVHVLAMYATAGWPRLTAHAWLHGETVLHAVADTRFGRWDWDWQALQPVLAAATYYALVLEPAATLLLPLRITRRWCALGLIALHLGIELLADVGMWQFMMSAAVLAFLPDTWFAWIPGLRSARVASGPDLADEVIRAPDFTGRSEGQKVG